MPELPEVESVRRTLLPHLQGRRIRRIHLLKPGQIRYPEPDAFVAQLEGERIEDIGRRGKYLLIRLEGGGVLVAHLRMSGRLVHTDREAPLVKHTHVIFDLDDGTQLRYVDMRTFGGFHLLGPHGEGTPAGLQELGPEPLDPEFNPEYLAGKLAGKRAPVKAAILDQRLVAGLGNIYADESLFLAGVRPDREAQSLTGAEIARLHRSCIDVLQRAIAKRGTTFSLYADGEGNAGDFYDDLQVYERKGAPCKVCGHPIEKTRVGGRGTHYCPQCQA